MQSLASAGVVDELRRRMEALREDDERRWGVMTAQQAVLHLRGAFAMAIGERKVRPLPGPLPMAVTKYLALRVPMRWPKNLQTVTELRQMQASSMSFDEEKREMLEAYGRFLRMEENSNDHPMLGRMSPWDWMRWGYLHTDHHLRQFGR